LLPVLALGGVTAKNAALLTGLSGIAAIEALGALPGKV
jgi:thiamine monophosphate synthase